MDGARQKRDRLRFDLIMPSVGRVEDARRALESLESQTYKDFDLILVDQSPDERLVPILAPYKESLSIRHLRSHERGAARARNTGLDATDATPGDIVAFPDDDCHYPPDLLERVARFFAGNPKMDGLSGRATDGAGRDSIARFDTTPGPVTKLNTWRRGVEFTTFLRASSVRGLRFDPRIGPGAGTAWGCGEGTDYLLSMLERGGKVHYDPSIVVFHESPVPPYTEKAVSRAYAYGKGAGEVLRRHRYPLLFKVRWLVRPFGGAILSLIGRKPAEARYRFNTARGRLDGMLGVSGRSSRS